MHNFLSKLADNFFTFFLTQPVQKFSWHLQLLHIRFIRQLISRKSQKFRFSFGNTCRIRLGERTGKFFVTVLQEPDVRITVQATPTASRKSSNYETGSTRNFTFGEVFPLLGRLRNDAERQNGNLPSWKLVIIELERLDVNSILIIARSTTFRYFAP